MALMFNLMNMTFHAQIMEQSRIDNFTRARAMLDVMAEDIQGGVFRPDLPAFGTGNGMTSANGITMVTNGAPVTAFYTRNPSTMGSSRNLSLVVYQLDGSTNAIFQRNQLGVPWTAPSPNWTGDIPFQGELANETSHATAQNIATGVVGFQLYFYRNDQSITNSYYGYQPSNPVIAIGVALAVVDSRTLKVLNATGKLSALTNALATPAAVSGTNSVKADWDRYMNSGTFFPNYPASLPAGMETFERRVPCNPSF